MPTVALGEVELVTRSTGENWVTISLVLGRPGPGGNGLPTSSACGGRPLSGNH